MSRNMICVILMLTVAPIIVCATVVCLEPSRWGGSINPAVIVVMAMFGLISTPLWPTYIPSLIITPRLMMRVARVRVFKTMQLSGLIGISIVVGAIAGALVLSPMILMTQNEPKMAKNWMIAGLLAGAITFSLIVLVYRREQKPMITPPPLPGDKCNRPKCDHKRRPN